MKHALTFVVAPIVLALSSSNAAADPATDLGKALDQHFNMWMGFRADPGSRANALTSDPQASECDAAIATARKAGLKDDARIYEGRVRELKDDVQYDDQKQPYVTLGVAAAMCKEWRKMVLLAPVADKMKTIVQTQESYSQVEPGSMSLDDSFLKSAQECLDMADKAVKAGAPADHKMKIRDKVMTLAEGKTAVCQAHMEWAKELNVKIKGARDADRDKRAAPYKAAGVAGKKLELFLEYDDVYWRGGKNCQRIDDIKVLAKAKALFHWLENSDGTHTIRKYTFNGNNYSGPVSKTYRTAGAAQKGCR